MINKNFQNRLKYYRKARKLTQDELGEILGVSGQTIYKYENGITFPPAETLEKILHYFKIDPNTLFKYENTTDDYLEEIKNMLENHKRLYHDLSYLIAYGEDNVIEDFMVKEYPELKGKYTQKNILEFQRYLLLQDIERIILNLEKESFQEGNPYITNP